VAGIAALKLAISQASPSPKEIFMSYLTSLSAVDHASAHGAQKEMLDTALKQVGFIPNMYANMVNAPALLGTYLNGYGRFRGESGFAPAEQEIVFLAVSMANGCTYCAAAHSMIADKMSGVPAPVLKAIREGHHPRRQVGRALVTRNGALNGRLRRSSPRS
jgi:AhpD family alkylhydroperoxidase